MDAVGELIVAGTGAGGVAGIYLVIRGATRKPIGTGNILVGFAVLALVAVAISIIVAGAGLASLANH